MENFSIAVPDSHRSPALSDLLLILKSELRREILRLLVKSPHSVTDLVNALQLEQSTVSHGLSMLRQHGLVRASRRKKQHIYRLSDDIATRTGHFAVQFTIRCRHREELTIQLQLGSGDRPPDAVTASQSAWPIGPADRAAHG